MEIFEAYIPGVDDPVPLLEQVNRGMTEEEVALWYPPGTVEGTFEERVATLLGGSPKAEAGREFARSLGGEEMIGLGGSDARGNGLVVGLVVDPVKLEGRARLTQRRIGVHLTTAMRLRESLGQKNALEEAEAIFEADGTLAHVEGEATSLRDVLQDRVRRVDRSRAASAATGDDPLAVWQGLVEGRWSLIDRFDTDGRRYYVALVNPAAAVESRALTDTEAQIVAMAVTGEPNKVIAYALGLAEGTVGAKLSEAMLKLGMKSRVGLIRFGRTLLGDTAA